MGYDLGGYVLVFCQSHTAVCCYINQSVRLCSKHPTVLLNESHILRDVSRDVLQPSIEGFGALDSAHCIKLLDQSLLGSQNGATVTSWQCSTVLTAMPRFSTKFEP